jgi:aconitate hydratase
MFATRYADVFKGDKNWQGIKITGGQTYAWDRGLDLRPEPALLRGHVDDPHPGHRHRGPASWPVRRLDHHRPHLSPAGSIKKTSPAGQYLIDHGVDPLDFNGYGARRGNHEVMMRGTFANIRIRNKITPDIEGGVTKHFPTGEVMSIYDAAMRYQAEGRPAVVFGGKEYGTGSSRDWAAKGTKLLGVRAVICESFERIHRSNLVGMGVLPCSSSRKAGRSWS